MAQYGARRKLRILVGVLLGLAALVFIFAVGRPVKVLPRMAPAPPFELFDASGAPVQAPRAGSPITFYLFGATRDEQGMQQVRRFYQEASEALGAAGFGEKVAFRLITVDPDHDTPDVLQQAAAALGPRQGAPLTLLTGSWVAIRMVVGTGFGVYFSPASDRASPPAYDRAVVVVDGNHVIRARYGLEQVDTKTLVRDVNLLLKEADATGATRWIYEGAHLFLCYPR